MNKRGTMPYSTWKLSILRGAIARRAMTIDEIASDMQIPRRTARGYVVALRLRGMAYLAEWARTTDGLHVKPAYRAGRRPDVPRPTPARRRPRKGETVRRTTRPWNGTGAAKRSPLDSALFGPAMTTPAKED